MVLCLLKSPFKLQPINDPGRSDRPPATTHLPGFKLRNYIGLDEYLNICQQNGFTQRNDKLQLSSYLHDLGVSLHFQEDALLNKTVILKPKWGTDAVYKVLDNEKVIRNLGSFTRSDLANIWCEDEYATMHDELLRLMINFKLWDICWHFTNLFASLSDHWYYFIQNNNRCSATTSG
ncbi:COR domain-containing protein [Nostoc sp.]|uniref:COR domain-containing protein n=1 Tax=Nostoc sp. TaxID=1180 RepID=UPI002FFC76AB